MPFPYPRIINSTRSQALPGNADPEALPRNFKTSEAEPLDIGCLAVCLTIKELDGLNPTHGFHKLCLLTRCQHNLAFGGHAQCVVPQQTQRAIKYYCAERN